MAQPAADDSQLVAAGPGPGPNGLRVFRREVYVAVSPNGTVVAVPIEPDGSAGWRPA